MDAVAQLLIVVATLLLVGALGEFVFCRTGLPEALGRGRLAVTCQYRTAARRFRPIPLNDGALGALDAPQSDGT
jgi:hypothetical protein